MILVLLKYFFENQIFVAVWCLFTFCTYNAPFIDHVLEKNVLTNEAAENNLWINKISAQFGSSKMFVIVTVTFLFFWTNGCII